MIIDRVKEVSLEESAILALKSADDTKSLAREAYHLLVLTCNLGDLQTSVHSKQEELDISARINDERVAIADQLDTMCPILDGWLNWATQSIGVYGLRRNYILLSLMRLSLQ